MFSKLKTLWNGLPDGVKRVLHTGWQTFLAVFLAGITGIISSLLKTHNLSDAESAVLALVGAALAAAFSAVKGAVLAKR